MGADFMSNRKKLGQYFTPQGEAEWLARWAIRNPRDRILEPSVGDGALLASAIQRVNELERGRIASITGCDIDPNVISKLRSQVDVSVELIEANFLELDPSIIDPVEVVIANPPFTRNHEIPPEFRKALKQRYPVKGAAGLWVYFILHACNFLKPGGRIAVLVPGAATFAEYALELVSQLKLVFTEVELHELKKKPSWIGGADERGVVLLADGFRNVTAANFANVPAAPYVFSSTLHSHPEVFTKLNAASKPLSSYAELSIGAVTGCNRVFLLNQSEVETWSLSESDLVPIVTRSRHVRGLATSRDDLAALANEGQKTWLLRPDDLGEKHNGIRRRLSLINARDRRNVVWLNKRKPWWKVDLGGASDAVFTYMNDVGPRLSLLEDGLTCTNTLHKVKFRDGFTYAEKMAIALSMLTSFGQLAAEGIGRGYGGGLMKFELREAKIIPILPISSVNDIYIFSDIDELLAKRKLDEARDLADEVMLPDLLGSRWRKYANDLRNLLQLVRSSRRNGNAKIFRYEDENR